MSKIDLLVIVLLFYAGWFASVFLALTDHSFMALLFPLFMFLFLFVRNLLGVRVLILAIAVSAIGILFDYFLIRAGFLSISGGSVGVPAWLVSIWLLFSLSFVNIGKQFQTSLWVFSLVGFFVGPLSYQSGEFFKVLSFSSSMTFLIYAVFWAVMIPSVLFLVRRWA